MNRLFRLALALTLPIALLSGCGKSTEEKVNDGNSKIERMNAINNELRGKQVGIQTLSGSYDSLIDGIAAASLKQMSSTELQHTIDLLNEYIGSANSVMGLLDSKDVVYGGSKDDLVRYRDHAAALLKQAQKQQQSSASAAPKK